MTSLVSTSLHKQNNMPIFDFSKQEKEAIIGRIREYVSQEMDQEIGQFEAGSLLNFFSEEIGPFFYNKGIQDGQAIVQKRVDDILGAIESLEKPVHQGRKNVAG